MGTDQTEEVTTPPRSLGADPWGVRKETWLRLRLCQCETFFLLPN